MSHALGTRLALSTMLSLALSAALLAAPQTDSNRSVDASGLAFHPIPGSTDVELQVTTIVSSLLPGPVDLGMDVTVFVDGAVVGTFPLAASTSSGPGDAGCNSTCSSPACPSSNPCVSYIPLGGSAVCSCGYSNTGTWLLTVVPGQLVGVSLSAALGSIGELYTADDQAFVEFEGTFASLCNGDGGDQLGCTSCPCANDAPQGTTGGCLNSAGSASRLGAVGDPSVSLPPGSSGDVRFTMTGGPAAATSVLLSGAAVAPTNPASPCFGLASGSQAADRDGLRCAVQSVLRHGNRQSDLAGAILASSGPSRVWGGEAQPTAGIAGASGFTAGQTRFFQVTHRDDPALVCMRGLNTSQAVEVTFTP